MLWYNIIAGQSIRSFLNLSNSTEDNMIKIVIVDDEKEICEYISNFFQERGHETFAVANPREVLPFGHMDLICFPSFKLFIFS